MRKSFLVKLVLLIFCCFPSKTGWLSASSDSSIATQQDSTPIFAPLNLYYQANKYKLGITTQIEDYFNDLKVFLGENPSLKVSIVGHSDDGDTDAWNERVARYRATQVGKVLEEMEFPKDRIIIEHKSNSTPLSADSPAKKNRRVEVRIIN